jgi:hypothetical protein
MYILLGCPDDVIVLDVMYRILQKCFCTPKNNLPNVVFFIFSKMLVCSFATPWTSREVPTFRRNMLPPSSSLKKS